MSANATKKVEQAILKDADGNIETIYEEVEDATTHQRQSVKICGACLAATTPLYGTTQTLSDAQPQQPIQTLEADGSVGWRKVVGTLRRRVSEYVRVWVGGERVEASVDHEFKSDGGWLSAGALRKGVLLVSLATGSLLPVDSVALVHQPLEVKGLNVGTAQGYGVGKWGLLTAPSNGWCVRGLDLVGHQKFNAWINKYKATLQYGGKTGDDAADLLAKDLGDKLNGHSILMTEEGATGRFVIQADRGAQTNRAFCLEPSSNGGFAINEYKPTYDPTANPSIDVDISTNSYLAPDYTTKGGIYLYPQTAMQPGQLNVVEIEMTGSTSTDFRAANNVAQFSGFGSNAPNLNGVPYTWHHLDNFRFDSATGKSYCTMQLVQSDVHTRVVGMAHSGGVAQYEKYWNVTYR